MAHDTDRNPLPEFDVVLITHNRIEITIECLNALYQNTPAPFHLTVVDDSTDLTPQYFETFVKEHDNVTYLHTEVKCGNHAFKLGIDNARTDIIVSMTNSSRVEPDWFKAPLELFKGDGAIGLIGIKLLHLNNTIWHAGIGFFNSIPHHYGQGEPSHRQNQIQIVPAVNFSVGFFRKDAFAKAIEEIGYDYYIPWRSFDDTDVNMTLHEGGWKIVYCGVSTAYHIESPTRKMGDQQKFWNEYNENMRRFLAKWLDKGCLN